MCKKWVSKTVISLLNNLSKFYNSLLTSLLHFYPNNLLKNGLLKGFSRIFLNDTNWYSSSSKTDRKQKCFTGKKPMSFDNSVSLDLN